MTPRRLPLPSLLSLLLLLLLPLPGLPLAPHTAYAEARAFPAAPSIAVEWLKGGPVDLNKPGQLYVIELWATWCGPCIEGFPHLSELRRARKGALEVVAISDETPKQVRRFLDKHSATMDFAVATDRDTVERWSLAFGVESIPTAFLVRDGLVLWGGHPDDIDLILRAIDAGDWTPDAQAKLAAVEVAAEAYLISLLDPDLPKPDDALARQLLTDARYAPRVLNMVAWIALTDAPPARRPPLPLLLDMAKTAAEVSDFKDASILDTYALALFTSGDRAAAITQSERALALCERDPYALDCAPLREALARFQAVGPSLP